MKKIAILLILMLIPAVSQAAFIWDDPCEDVRQDLADCGQKVVDMGQEAEAAEQAKHDAIAVSVAAGVFIGAGGLQALVPVVGGALALPFILFGF